MVESLRQATGNSSAWWIVAVSFLLVLLATWLAARLLLRMLERRAHRGGAGASQLLATALRGPSTLWALLLASHAAVQVSQLPVQVRSLTDKALLVLWILSLTVVAARLAVGGVGFLAPSVGGLLPATTLTQNVARLAVTVLGGLILLNVLGVSITPMLTALGVGGLAVALALQDTLANLFAGFYITMTGHLRPGDYIRLDSGEEGYVNDISWRATLIRTLPNSTIVVPNAKLAQAIVTNYHLPEPRMSLLIPISVSYDSDPEHVERVLLEEAQRAAQEIPGMLAEPAPFVRFIPGFGDSSLNFTLICQVREFVDQYPVQHELRKRIFRRFRQEGIEIPFPIRTVYLRDAEKRGHEPQ